MYTYRKELKIEKPVFKSGAIWHGLKPLGLAMVFKSSNSLAVSEQK